MTTTTDDLVAALLGGTRPGAGREVVIPPDPTSTRGTPEGSAPTGGRQTRLVGISLIGSGGESTFPRIIWTSPEMIEMYGAEGVAELCDGSKARLLVDEGESVLFRKEPKRPPLWILRKPDGKPNYANVGEQERFLVESGQIASCNGDRSVKPEPWESWIMRQPGSKRTRKPPKGYGHDGKLLPPKVVETPPIERLAQRTMKQVHLGAARRSFALSPEKARLARQREQRFKEAREAGAAVRRIEPVQLELVVTPPKKQRKRRSNALLSDDRVRELHRDYEAGATLWELANRVWEELGYSSPFAARNAIGNGFKSFGLTIRPRGGDHRRQKEAA